MESCLAPSCGSHLWLAGEVQLPPVAHASVVCRQVTGLRTRSGMAAPAAAARMAAAARRQRPIVIYFIDMNSNPAALPCLLLLLAATCLELVAAATSGNPVNGTGELAQRSWQGGCGSQLAAWCTDHHQQQKGIVAPRTELQHFLRHQGASACWLRSIVPPTPAHETLNPAAGCVGCANAVATVADFCRMGQRRRNIHNIPPRTHARRRISTAGLCMRPRTAAALPPPRCSQA